jgi:RNA polymerase sigma-70 factor (ECF subfamily)
MSSDALPAAAGHDGGLCGTDEVARGPLLSALLEHHRDRLLRMVAFRMHPQVRARVDASDVIQDAYIEAVERIDEYVSDPQLPFFLWLRRLTGQRLGKTHRFHLDAQSRDARRQTRDGGADMPDVSVIAMVERLASDATTPTQAAARGELRLRVAERLGELEATDREVLAMRHFEGLSNDEVAHELGVTKYAASKRYIRALQRLKGLLGDEAPAA